MQQLYCSFSKFDNLMSCRRYLFNAGVFHIQKLLERYKSDNINIKDIYLLPGETMGAIRLTYKESESIISTHWTYICVIEQGHEWFR